MPAQQNTQELRLVGVLRMVIMERVTPRDAQPSELVSDTRSETISGRERGHSGALVALVRCGNVGRSEGHRAP